MLMSSIIRFYIFRLVHKQVYEKSWFLGEPSGKFDYYVQFTPPPINPSGSDVDDDDDCNQLHKEYEWIIVQLHLHNQLCL